MRNSSTQIPIFDGHNDALTAPDRARLASGRDGGHLDLPRMRTAGMRGGIFAVFVPSANRSQSPGPRPTDTHYEPPAPRVAHARAAALSAAAAGRLFALERQGALRVARNAHDLDAARDGQGPPVAVLHFEGAEAIDGELESLETWYAAGLRSLGPVWSRPNRFAHGVPFAFPSSPDTGPGLTADGRRLVRRCAELGIAVDLAHMNEAGFWDVARLEPGPLIVSHAGAHTLAPCSRNLTDKQIDAVGASGGVVGIVFSCYFLRADFANDPENTPLSLIVAHIRHVADRIGTGHVAFGSDFDGTTIPAALGDVAGLPRLLEALVADGFSPAEVRAIAWDNWRRVLGAWWR
ncbi:MAG: dipeptidase [Solirubrobacteraceae bacterium]